MINTRPPPLFLHQTTEETPHLLLHCSLQLKRIKINPMKHNTSSPCSSSSSSSTAASGCAEQQKQERYISNDNRVCPVPDWISAPDDVIGRHTHAVEENQCCCATVQAIDAPVETVWSVVRRFDKPQAYKQFLKSCHVIRGDGDVGTLREVRVVSGLPAQSSTERLDVLDEEKHVMSFSVVGGEHRLNNYRSVTTLHEVAASDGGGTVVLESYVVDVPLGNTREETCAFVGTILRCNLQSLAHIAKDLARKRTG